MSSPLSAAVFDGNDFEAWLAHFKLTPLKTYLTDTVGVACLTDLAEIYSDGGLMIDIRNNSQSLVFRRFIKAAPLTTVLHGVPVAYEIASYTETIARPPPAPNPSTLQPAPTSTVLPPGAPPRSLKGASDASATARRTTHSSDRIDPMAGSATARRSSTTTTTSSSSRASSASTGVGSSRHSTIHHSSKSIHSKPSAIKESESSDKEGEECSSDEDSATMVALKAKQVELERKLKRDEEKKKEKEKKRAELEADIRRLEDSRTAMHTSAVDVGASTRDLSRKKHHITKKKALLSKLEKDLREAASLDVAFVVDCTASMGPYISSVKTHIQELGAALKATYPQVPMRLAFVGYRDYSVANPTTDRLTVLRFTSDLDAFQRFVGSTTTIGNYDTPEDVLGGLSVASGLEWSSATRVLYHIGDAPCHGSKYHSGDDDQYPGGDPHGLTPEVLLPAIAAQNILYFFGKITEDTNKMIQLFNEVMQTGATSSGSGGSRGETGWLKSELYSAVRATTGRKDFIETLSVTSGTLMSTLAASVSSSMASSVSFSASTAEKIDSSSIPMDKNEPRWSSLTEETILLYDVILPSSVAELVAWEDSAMVNAASPRTARTICAKLPFDKGSTRLAYKAKEFPSSSTGVSTATAAAATTVAGEASIASSLLRGFGLVGGGGSSSRSGNYCRSSGEGRNVIQKISIKTKPSELTRHVYESVLANHCVGLFFAREFRKVKPPSYPPIEFADIQLINYTERTPHYPYATQEAALEGAWEKYNNNHGWVALSPTAVHATDHTVVQAFSHWTHTFSGGEMMLVDCQGVYQRGRSTTAKSGFLFTDPAIHCKDITRFGGTNLGKNGFKKFFATHECNDCCRALGLRKPAL